MLSLLKNLFSGDDSASSPIADTPLVVVNPATGLPMMDNGMCGIDVGGSPLGMDIHDTVNDGFSGSIDSNQWD